MKILTKKLLFVFVSLFLLSFSAGTNAQTSGNVVFNGTQVYRIDLEFTQANFFDSLIFYYNQGLETNMFAKVTLTGTQGVVSMDTIGVRMKGNSTFSHPNNKKPFKVTFDEYDDDKLWDGMKSITLNNCYLDPTFMREKMHLDFCRDAGIIAPRCSYANLYINGVLYGLYSMVESVDKKFLKSRFGNSNGNSFKAVDAFTNSIFSDLKWYGTTQASYANRYELKTNEEENNWTDLLQLIDTINLSTTTETGLPTKMNLPTYYKQLAADIIMGNYDSYVGSGRNYYLYDVNVSGRFDWIAWDASLSFGAYPGGVSNPETSSLTYVSSSTNRPLVAKVYAVPSFKAAYLSSLCALAKTYFTSARLNPKIDSIATLIRPYVTADTKKQYTLAQFETGLISDQTLSGRRLPGLKAYITSRATSITSQLNTLGVTCETAITSNEPNFVSTSYSLAQNFPNPFNPITKIQFNLPKASNVKLTVFDAVGKEVSVLLGENMEAGVHSAIWDGMNFSSGVYYYRLETGDFTETRKMILMK